ncbi:GNAT family N-acetyltransferase [Leptothoe sp. PORK10 BA2]|uniref:GNAT family N-acetyltransferase n=1 Tax=Leptothoe sp. PORK10 BA2 TaxID=3110254 RepID=UPI002B21EB14|nr:GNAT family N-acetyltransferase [Leptothoe sp. PORK10 BA2]MEA5466583.1 GNAT family N-acetyltransferase [Leptothoe sp. PORK10 BA2]
MKIEIINTLEAFSAIRRNWEFVYQSDPESLFFVSWIWLSGRLMHHDQGSEPWSILGLKVDENDDDADYVAFMPLVIDLDETVPGTLYTELSIAGVTDANHVPFICLPDYEAAALSAFASYLQSDETWSVLTIRNIAKTDPRLSRFLAHFPQEDFSVQEQHHVNDVDCIDNNIVPYILLPDNWDSYLQQSLSPNTRQKVRRLLRKIGHRNEFQVTQANADTLDRDLKILFDFWEKSWAGRKGDAHCHNILKYAELNLRHCFANDCLYLSVLWRDHQPLGAIANLMDWQKKSILFLIGSRDDTVKNISSGIILHALGIQFAIQNQFKVYDFLMGNEAYKFSLGAQERPIKIVVLQRQDEPQKPRKLDPRTLPQAHKIASIYHQLNRLPEAEKIYRQILWAQPGHPKALYGLGVIAQRTGDFSSAEVLFRQFLKLQPDNVKGWFSLGTLYQTRGELIEAEQAFRQALTLPTVASVTAAIYHNLGYLLQQKDSWNEAIECYQQARTLQPDCIEAEVSWANAHYHQGNLSPEKQKHYAVLNHDLGDQRQEAGDLKVAIAYYRQAILMQPDLAKPYYQLGLALAAQSEAAEDEIMACYEKAWQLQPTYREAEVALANMQYRQHQLPTAKYSHYAAANYDLGNDYRKNNDLDVAIAYYRQAILIKPDLAEAHYQLGWVLQLKGQSHWDEAITCYQAAQALKPHDSAADICIATVRYRQGTLSQMDQQIYADQVYGLGNSLKQAGDMDAAIESYRLAIAMNPSLSAPRDALRLALQEQDNVTIKVSCAKR